MLHGGGGGTSSTGRRQSGIGLGGPIDGLSGLIGGLFLFLYIFSNLFIEAGRQPPQIRPD